MLIKKLHIDRFGGLEDRSVSFTPGLTIVNGVNEAGKSTLREFLNFGLFGHEWKTKGKGTDADQDKARAELMKPWGGSGEFGGTVTLDDGTRIEASLKPSRGRGNAFDIAMSPADLTFRRVGRSVFEGVYSLDLPSLVALRNADLSSQLGTDMSLGVGMRAATDVVSGLRAQADRWAATTGDGTIKKRSDAGALLDEIKELRRQASDQKKGLADIRDLEKRLADDEAQERATGADKERIEGEVGDLSLLEQAAERESEIRSHRNTLESLDTPRPEVLAHEDAIENISRSIEDWREVERGIKKKKEKMNDLQRKLSNLTIAVPEGSEVQPLVAEVDAHIARWETEAVAASRLEEDIEGYERKHGLLGKKKAELLKTIPGDLHGIVHLSPEAVTTGERALEASTAAASPQASPPYAMAGIGAGALVVLIALVTSNALGAVAGLLLAVIGVLLRSWRPAGGADPRSLAPVAEAFGVDANARDLPGALRERLLAWRQHEPSIMKLQGVVRDLDKLAGDSEDARARHDAALTRRGEAFTELRGAVPDFIPLSEDEDPGPVRARIGEYRTHVELRGKLAEADGELQEMEDRFGRFVGGIDGVWDEVFTEQDIELPWTAMVERLKDALDGERAKRDAHTEAERKVRTEEEELGRLRSRDGFPTAERARALLGTGLEDLPDPSAIKDRIKALKGEKDTLEKELRGRNRALGELRGTIDEKKGSLESQEHFDALVRDRQEQVEALKRKADAHRSAATLVEQVYRRFLDASRPDVLRTASAWFAEATGGAWGVIDYDREAPDWLSGIGIKRNEGAPLRRDRQLSTSTRELLYLAIRLAIVDKLNHQEGAEPVPMIIDDALVNLDPVRLQKAASIIKSFSEQNQVVMLTCHEHVVEAMRKAGTAKKSIYSLEQGPKVTK